MMQKNYGMVGNRLLTKALVSVPVLSAAFALRAEPIPIVNPSFEDLTGTNRQHFEESGRLIDGHWSKPTYVSHSNIGPFQSGSPIPGWQITAYGGVWKTDRLTFPAGLPEGQCASYLVLKTFPDNVLLEPVISQVLCRGLVTGRYTLKFSVGRSSADSYAGYLVELRAGNTVILRENDVQPVAVGTFVTRELMVDIPPDHPAIGQLLEIRLGGSDSQGSGRQVYFDDISLDGPPSPCRVLANSVTDYSGEQGKGNWYYGYYDLTDDSTPGYQPAEDFRPLPTSTYTTDIPSEYRHDWWQIAENLWTWMTATWASPNSGTNNNGRTLSEQWAIRRWVSTTEGVVHIGGIIGRYYTGGGGGDGVTGAIMINGETIFERTILGSDQTPHNYEVTSELKVGDFVDFVTRDAGSSIQSDFIYLTGIIEPALTIVSHPEDQSSCPGMGISFSVEAMGIEPISYQWKFNGEPISGKTNKTLVLESVQSSNGGTYSVLVSNPMGTVESRPAALRMFDACVEIQMLARLKVVGEVGREYVIRYTTDIGNTDFSTWTGLATNRLSSPDWFVLDFGSTNSMEKRYYGVKFWP